MHNTNADRDLQAIKDQLTEVIALLKVIAEPTPAPAPASKRRTK